MTTVTVLGSTGSVGQSTLDVVAANPDFFSLDTLTGGRNVEHLAQQAREHRPRRAVIADDTLYQHLKDRLSGTGIEVAAGRSALIEVAGGGADVTMCAIAGFAGLEPLMSAIRAGGRVAIANKEPLVAAGPLVMTAAAEAGATLLPVDSEHNAVFQLFEPDNRDRISKITLTASGGPFREWSLERMAAATPVEALKHPNWSMGAKISIDSATMMNKGLEVIEAHHLFNLPPERIDVIVHPQSIVHALVTYEDGSVLAHMGPTDMRVPIAHALGWPGRIAGAAVPLDLTSLSKLTFEAPDPRRFPAINLAYDCIRAGGAACCVLNAANEVAVGRFLEGRIGFGDIFTIVRQSVETSHDVRVSSIDDVLALDLKVRAETEMCIMNGTFHLSSCSPEQGRKAL